MRDDARDMPALGQPHVRPRLAAIGGLVDAVTPARTLAVGCLARANPHHVSVALEEAECAHRVHAFAFEHGRHRDGVVRGFPHAARCTGDIHHGWIRLRHSHIGYAPRHGGRPDEAEMKACQHRRVRAQRLRTHRNGSEAGKDDSSVNAHGGVCGSWKGARRRRAWERMPWKCDTGHAGAMVDARWGGRTLPRHEPHHQGPDCTRRGARHWRCHIHHGQHRTPPCAGPARAGWDDLGEWVAHDGHSPRGIRDPHWHRVHAGHPEHRTHWRPRDALLPGRAAGHGGLHGGGWPGRVIRTAHRWRCGALAASHRAGRQRGCDAECEEDHGLWPVARGPGAHQPHQGGRGRRDAPTDRVHASAGPRHHTHFGRGA